MVNENGDTVDVVSEYSSDDSVCFSAVVYIYGIDSEKLRELCD